LMYDVFMNTPSIYVVGMGNILLSDEGAGVRAVERLMSRYSFPAHVHLVDGGTTAMKGLLPIVEQADHLLVLDTVNGPGEPGQLYRFSGDDFRKNIPKKISAHDIGFLECLAIAEVNDRAPQTVTIIGVKPEDMRTPSMELTPKISAAVDGMVDMALAELSALGARAKAV